MQATVLSFDFDSHAGTVVSDAGIVLAFDGDAFAAGGLRQLSRGQRVRLVLSDCGDVVNITIYTLPDVTGEGAEPDGPTPS